MKLITGYSDYTADDLLHLGEKVGANVTKMSVFASLKPSGADVTAAATALNDAINLSGPGRKETLAQAFDALGGLLGDVAMNAPQTPGVTEADLAEIGLPQQKTPTRTTTVPPICENLRLRHGPMQGEVLGTCEVPASNVRIYVAQWTLDPNGGQWTDAGSFPNSRSFKFIGLPRGKDVWIRVAAVNVIGQGPWSDPATIMVV